MVWSELIGESNITAVSPHHHVARTGCLKCVEALSSVVACGYGI
jgi:hypothetical protein